MLSTPILVEASDYHANSRVGEQTDLVYALLDSLDQVIVCYRQELSFRSEHRVKSGQTGNETEL
jgi:hypothetical protein